MYSLKNIRRIRGLKGAGVTATICRDDRRIGWVQLPADGGRALFTFDADSERSDFEQFVETWWHGTRAHVPQDLLAVDLSPNDPNFASHLRAKMRYWVTAFIVEALGHNLNTPGTDRAFL